MGESGLKQAWLNAVQLEIKVENSFVSLARPRECLDILSRLACRSQDQEAGKLSQIPKKPRTHMLHFQHHSWPPRLLRSVQEGASRSQLFAVFGSEARLHPVLMSFKPSDAQSCRLADCQAPGEALEKGSPSHAPDLTQGISFLRQGRASFHLPMRIRKELGTQ